MPTRSLGRFANFRLFTARRPYLTSPLAQLAANVITCLIEMTHSDWHCFAALLCAVILTTSLVYLPAVSVEVPAGLLVGSGAAFKWLFDKARDEGA